MVGVSSLEAFLGRRTVTEGDGDSREPALLVGGSVAAPPSSSPSVTVYTDTAPSGIVVAYRPEQEVDGVKYSRQYTVNGAEVPSVTTVLDILRKDGLPWWGMKVGVEGVLELFRRDRLVADAHHVLLNLDQDATAENVTAALTAEKLTVNHVLGRAGDRGTSVHDALEQWARSGGEFFPTPVNFPEEERPYVEALLDWIEVLDGDYEITGCETMLGSAVHGFAGRCDLTLRLLKEKTFVERAYKRKDDKTVVVPPSHIRLDAKTSKGVYPSHSLQLEAYELAAVECGYEPTEERFVLRLGADGRYEFVRSRASAEQFLAVRACHRALEGLK